LGTHPQEQLLMEEGQVGFRYIPLFQADRGKPTAWQQPHASTATSASTISYIEKKCLTSSLNSS
jgi:hypothetical protein